MQIAFSNFLRGVVTITSIPSWRAQQALLLLSESMMAFLALFMLKQGFGQSSILGIFCAIFVVSGLIIRMQRRRITSNPKIIPAVLSITATTSTLCAILSIQPAISTALAALCVMAMKDMSTTTAVGDVHRAAERTNLPPSGLVSTGMLIGALLMILFLIGGGSILDLAPWGWTTFLLIANAAVLAALLKGVIHLKCPRSETPIPSRAKATCHLAMLYNGTHFVGRRFVLPLAIAQLATELGLGEQAYSALGGILSLLVLLGLATRSFSPGSGGPKAMMFGGYFTGLGLWIVLTIALMTTSGLTSALLAVPCLFLIEISSKIWTLGFIETLRLEASQVKAPTSPSEAELAYFSYFMEVKSYGAALGFVAAIISLLLGLPALIPMATVGIIAAALMLMPTRSSMAGST